MINIIRYNLLLYKQQRNNHCCLRWLLVFEKKVYCKVTLCYIFQKVNVNTQELSRRSSTQEVANPPPIK